MTNNEPDFLDEKTEPETVKDEGGYAPDGVTASPASDVAGIGQTPREENTNTSEDVEKLDLYDANKGLLKRDGGPYLDEVEKERAEIIRAKREDREPDLENPPATAGTVLVPKHYLRETDSSKRHVAAAAELENDPVTTIEVDTSSEFDKDPDPAQASWDNDQQKLDALNASNKYNEATEKNNTPDVEPVDESEDNPDHWNK